MHTQPTDNYRALQADAHAQRLKVGRTERAKSRAKALETEQERKKRLEAKRASKTKALATETADDCRKPDCILKRTSSGTDNMYIGMSHVGNANDLKILTKCGLFVNAPGTYTDNVVSYEIL